MVQTFNVDTIDVHTLYVQTFNVDTIDVPT
jgi:hypothetical protein